MRLSSTVSRSCTLSSSPPSFSPWRVSDSEPYPVTTIAIEELRIEKTNRVLRVSFYIGGAGQCSIGSADLFCFRPGGCIATDQPDIAPGPGVRSRATYSCGDGARHDGRLVPWACN